MTGTSRPRLHIIVGSTRPGRAGLPVARWVAERAEKHGGFDVELIDLAEVALPLLDEPHHPKLRRYTHQHTLDWSATINRADAFVYVMPEYNHGVNAALKNAIDYLVHEWAHKPVGLVSYGGVAGGTRAVTTLKPTLSVLKMLPLTESVIIPFVAAHLDGDGENPTFVPGAEIDESATVMLDELARVIPVLARLQHR